MAAIVPAEAARVTVRLFAGLSTSAIVTAERSRFDAVSSSTVTEAGKPAPVGKSLTAVMFTLTVPNVTEGEP